MTRQLTLAFMLFSSVALATAQTARPYDQELVRLQHDFVRILREKRTTDFLSYIGPKGVAFGVDAEFQSRKKVADEFRRKRGAYCVLFDSTCLRRRSDPTNTPLMCSARGLLLNRVKPEVTITLGTFEGKPQAYLGIASKAPSCLDGTQSFKFIFTRLPTGWKLVAVPYT